MRATPDGLKAAADYINRGDKWRVTNCSADFPEQTEGYWFFREAPGIEKDTLWTGPDTQVIELAKDLGWKG